MKYLRRLIYLLICIVPFLAKGQTRNITGTVISEYEMTPIPGVKVHTSDTMLLGVTDMNGKFKIELTTEIDNLLLGAVGMEWTSIKFANCDILEIIMMVHVRYDFVTIKTVNRKRQRRFKDLDRTHRLVYENGLFASKEPCVTYIFDKY